MDYERLPEVRKWMQMAHSTGLLQFQVRPRQKPIAPLRFFPDVPGPWSRIALKGEPLAREAASKTDETRLFSMAP